VFGWFKSEKRERRRKVKLDRKHLEARSRRFLKSYLNADETRKPQFYRAVEEASKQCQPVKLGLPPPELEDAQIAEATSGAAMKMVLGREGGALKKDDRISDFVTDAYATVGIPSRSRCLHDGQRDAGTRNCSCSPSHHGDLIHEGTKRLTGECGSEESLLM
jgi:hypothetical protein